MATIQELESALIKADAVGNSADAKVFADEIRRMRAAANPAEGGSRGAVESFGAGLGAGFGRTMLGAQDLIGQGLQAVGDFVSPPERTVSSLVTGQNKNSLVSRAGEWLQKDAQQGRQNLLNELQPYADSSPIAAGAGKIGGEIAATLPVGGVLAKGIGSGASALGAGRAAAPLVDAIASAGMRSGGIGGVGGLALKSAGGAITGGAATAMVDPNAAKTGALIGAAIPAVWQGASRVAGAAGKAISSRVLSDPVARRAVELGAPVGIAEVSNNGVVRGTRSLLNDSLLSGGAGARQQAAKQAWFNRTVGRTFGAEADTLTPEVMDAAKKRLGDEFDRIWGNNNIRVDDEFLGALSRLRGEAELLPTGEGRRLLSHLDDIEGRVAQGVDGELVIPGDVANRFQSSLRRVGDGAQGFLKANLNDLRQSVVGAFNRSVAPADAAALRLTQNQYKALKTVEPLLNKAETAVAGRTPGDVPAALLSQAVVNSYKGGVAKSPLTEAAKIGQRFLVDRTPQTGGSMRAAIQNTAVGGLLTAGALTNPYTLLAIPAAAGVNKVLGSPRLVRGLLASPVQGAGAGLLRAPGITGGLLDLGVRAAPLLSSGQ